MMSEAPAETVARIDRAAERRATPCGGGRMVWRLWGEGPPLVLLHGAFGSWTHWLRNVEGLARHFRVIAPDMPGYGDSDEPPQPYSPESLADLISAGLDAVLPPPAPFDLAGFSFGGIIAGHVAARQAARLRTLVLLGPNGMALPRGEAGALRRLDPDMTPDEVAAVHRHNLGVLMIADPARVDDLAVHLQIENARRSRTKSGRIPESDSLLQALPAVRARICGLWGGRDAMALPFLDQREAVLRRFRPDLDFRIVPGAGHWAPYEAPEAVNAALRDMLLPV